MGWVDEQHQLRSSEALLAKAMAEVLVWTMPVSAM
jgi:hypothetical protein